jgi:hypothetical protein
MMALVEKGGIANGRDCRSKNALEEYCSLGKERIG